MTALEKMCGDLTLEEAQELFDSRWWEAVPVRHAALAQLRQPRLCIPFDEFVFVVARAMGLDEDALPDTALRNPKALIRVIESQPERVRLG